MTNRRNKKIALMFALSRQHEGQVLRGIMDYAAKLGTWSFDINPEQSNISLASLVGWSGDAIVAPLRSRQQVEIARSFGVPVINTAGSLRETGFPLVMVDQEAVGRLAANHLLERGFKRFGYYGQKNAWYSKQRQAGFVTQIEKVGGQCSILEAPQSFNKKNMAVWLDTLKPWLESMRPPFGVMAVHDYRARMVLEVCLRMGLKVPQDVAIIGVDNDEVACVFSEVPISSVARDPYREGCEVAVLLDHLMNQQKTENHILVQPKGVVARRSTEVDAIENPYVAKAVKFVKDNISKSFGVEALEQHVDVSRRYLYYQFQEYLNCTPHQYIIQARINLAKKMLVNPKKLQLQEISRACGFSEARRFRLVFRRMTGVPPSEFRRSQLSNDVFIES